MDLFAAMTEPTPSEPSRRQYKKGPFEMSNPEQPTAKSPPLSDGDLKANSMLGLRGSLAQYSQAGAFGAVVVGAALIIGFMLMWVRNDAKEQLKQQSIERAEDRELRKEIAVVQANAMEKLAGAIGDFKIELRERDIKMTNALDKLTQKIDRMP